MLKLLRKSLYRIIVLLILFSTLITPPNAYAEQLQTKQGVTLTILGGKNDCSTATDLQAPCRSEVFKIESLTKSITKSVTCGVNVYNALSTKVATISETVRFTTTDSTILYTVNSASRSTWVTNSTYAWRNLSGPTPSSGQVNIGGPGGPSTVGNLYYLGGNWGSWRTTLMVSSQTSWYCY